MARKEFNLQELTKLKKKFEQIKGDTEDFIQTARDLSDRGVKDAKVMIASAKKEWQTLKTAYNKEGLSAIVKTLNEVQQKVKAKKKSFKKSKAK